jgi:hypothetical protein
LSTVVPVGTLERSTPSGSFANTIIGPYPGSRGGGVVVPSNTMRPGTVMVLDNVNTTSTSAEPTVMGTEATSSSRRSAGR